jgi:hypothetical protein
MQSNIIKGAFIAPANADLTGMEDRLVKPVNDSGTLEISLPAANTDECPYVLTEGGEAGDDVTVEPFTADRQFRIITKDALVPGTRLCLADVATAADKGKVRALPTAAGTYRVFAVAEATAAAGSLALIRKTDAVSVVVTE